MPGTVQYPRNVAQLHYGPARVPSRESPEEAVALLQERGYTACEIDFEGKFWMDYPWAEKFGELARAAGIVLSVHAPIAGFMGHAERGKKLNMAVGMLDHSAGIARAAGAAPVVFHPGYLLGRERDAAIDSVVEQLGELRERLEGKDRAVPFGVEIMGRVRELGTADDVFAISSRCGWVRVAVARAQELRVGRQHVEQDAAVLAAGDDLERLAEQGFGFLVPALSGPDLRQRDPRGSARDDVLGADGLAGGERVLLGLV